MGNPSSADTPGNSVTAGKDGSKQTRVPTENMKSNSTNENNTSKEESNSNDVNNLSVVSNTNDKSTKKGNTKKKLQVVWILVIIGCIIGTFVALYFTGVIFKPNNTSESPGGSDGSTGGTDGSTGGTDGGTGGTDGSTGGSGDGSTGGSDGSTGGTDGSTGGSGDGSTGGSDGSTGGSDGPYYLTEEQFPIGITNHVYKNIYTDILKDRYETSWEVTNNNSYTNSGVHQLPTNYRAAYLFVTRERENDAEYCTITQCNKYLSNARHCGVKAQVIPGLESCQHYYIDIRLENTQRKYVLTRISFKFAFIPNHKDFNWFPCKYYVQGRNISTFSEYTDEQSQEPWETIIHQDSPCSITIEGDQAWEDNEAILALGFSDLPPYNSFRIVFYQSHLSLYGRSDNRVSISDMKFFGKKEEYSTDWFLHAPRNKSSKSSVLPTQWSLHGKKDDDEQK